MGTLALGCGLRDPWLMVFREGTTEMVSFLSRSGFWEAFFFFLISFIEESFKICICSKNRKVNGGNLKKLGVGCLGWLKLGQSNVYHLLDTQGGHGSQH